MKSFSNKASFVAVDGAISFSFEAKNPFAADYVHVGGSKDKGPSVVVEECIKFSVHGGSPGRVLGSC